MASESDKSKTTVAAPVKKQGLIKRAFSSAATKFTTGVFSAGKKTLKIAKNVGLIYAAERVVENVYEGVSGKDVNWTVGDGKFGVAVVDDNKVVEVVDRNKSGKNSNLDVSAGVNLDLQHMNSDQNIVGVKVGDTAYGITKEDVGSVVNGVTNKVSSMGDAFSKSSQIDSDSVVTENDVAASASQRECGDENVDYSGDTVDSVEMGY